MPTTSQATPDEFLRVLTPFVNSGDDVIVITLSSKLSGTYQREVIAATARAAKVLAIIFLKFITVPPYNQAHRH